MDTNTEGLLVVWTSGEREVALNMVFMYTLNSRLNNWWDKVTMLIWGPSGKILVTDEELQERIKTMREAGVRLVACKKCADNYSISDQLEDLGVEVFYSGGFLTDWIRSAGHVITF